MAEVAPSDVLAKFAPLDDAVIAQVIATGATLDDLEVARAWMARNAGIQVAADPPPFGATGRVIAILERDRQARKHPITSSPLGEAGSTLE